MTKCTWSKKLDNVTNNVENLCIMKFLHYNSSFNSYFYYLIMLLNKYINLSFFDSNSIVEGFKINQKHEKVWKNLTF